MGGCAGPVKQVGVANDVRGKKRREQMMVYMVISSHG